MKKAYWKYIILLCAFFSLAGFLLIHHAKSHHLESTRALALAEVRMLNSAIGQYLRDREYEAAESMVGRWGKDNPDVAFIKVESQKGFVLASFERPEKLKIAITVRQSLIYLPGKSVLTTLGILDAGYDVYIRRAALELGLSGFALFLFFALSLWFFLKRSAISPLKRELEQRQATEADLMKLTQAVEQSPSSVIITDPTGTIEYVNPRFTEVTGYPRIEVWGQNPRILRSGYHEDSFYKDLWETISSGRKWQGVIQNKAKDGHLFWELASITSIRDSSGKIAHYVGMKEDITEMVHAREELTAANQLRVTILANLQDEIALIDAETFEILETNKNLTESAPEETRTGGLTCHKFFHRETGPCPCDDDDCPIQTAVKTKTTATARHSHYTQEGEKRLVEVSAAPIFKGDGPVRQVVFVSRDVTELVAAQEVIEDSRRQAEQASQAKSAFLATMSHEIRTPLNGVIGMTRLLLDTELSIEQRQLAETAQSSAEVLLAVINDILDLSKIEAGRLELERKSFPLYLVVEDVLDNVASAAQGKNLELWSVVSEKLPPRVWGDSLRFKQVLFNLLGNAVKFTEKGEVGVKVSLQDKTGGNILVRFEVSDTGIGIEPKDMERLFAPFTQAEPGTSRRFGGTGLGLSISRRLVEIMGGEMGVESEPGKGSLFWFVIPWEQAPADTTWAQKTLSAIAGQRVFCAEQNAGSPRGISSMLDRWGMDCDDAPEGPEALELIRKALKEDRPFKLAVIDLQLKVMDGFTLAGIIREDPDLKDLRLVALCPLYSSEVNRDRLKNLFDEVLTKPIRRDNLRRCLVKLLSPGLKLKPGEDKPSSPEPADKRFIQAHILLAEDNLINQQLATRLLAKMGHKVRVANNGREAVEELARRDYDLVLMDCQMPEMDGFQATAEIRKMEGPKSRIPIIAMTAHAMSGDRERCLAAGMDDYMAKPFHPETLAFILQRHLEKAANPKAPQALKPEPAPAVAKEPPRPAAGGFRPDPAPSPAFDQEGLMARLQGDREIASVIVRSFMQTSEDRLSPLERAVRDGDSKAAVLEAHNLKGVLSNLSALAGSEIAAGIEAAARESDWQKASAGLDDLRIALERLTTALGDSGLAD